MLEQSLQDYGLSAKEAKLYLVCLELGNAPVSSIARRLGENRVTTYSNLKNLVKRGIVIESLKNKSTYYSVVTPQQLLDKLQKKYDSIKEKLPEFLAIANKYDNKPKVQFFEWLEGLKNVYEWIILYWWEEMPKADPYLTFTWTGDIDPRFQDYLVNEFAPWRLKFPRKTRSILAKSYENRYARYHTDRHDYLIVKDPIFDFSDEIVIYGKDKVAIAMYSTEDMCGLIITSKTLHQTLKSLFNLVWKLSKEK